MTMAYWLVKSNLQAGHGISRSRKAPRAKPGPACAISHARQNLVKMKKGDRAFFYHSKRRQGDRRIAEVIREAIPIRATKPANRLRRH